MQYIYDKTWSENQMSDTLPNYWFSPIIWDIHTTVLCQIGQGVLSKYDQWNAALLKKDFFSLDLNAASIDELVNSGSLSIIKDVELREQIANWSFIEADSEDDIEIILDAGTKSIILHREDININDFQIIYNEFIGVAYEGGD